VVGLGEAGRGVAAGQLVELAARLGQEDERVGGVAGWHGPQRCLGDLGQLVSQLPCQGGDPVLIGVGEC
jgi:hypothetical protein